MFISSHFDTCAGLDLISNSNPTLFSKENRTLTRSNCYKTMIFHFKKLQGTIINFLMKMWQCDDVMSYTNFYLKKTVYKKPGLKK